MDHEETTFSEQLIQSKPWKPWAKENWHFLAAILCLTALSLFLLVKNQLQAPPMVVPADVMEPSAEPPAKPSAPPAPQIKRNRDPLSAAKTLYQQGYPDKATALLLNLAKNHPSLPIRKKSAQLAKAYHFKQQENYRVKKIYLEGYILFHTHPEQACDRWKHILYSSEQEDTYYQKARWRWERDCLPYFNEK